MKAAFSLFLACLAGLAFSVTGMAGPYQIDLRTDPAVIPVGKARLVITISEAGKPVSGAKVTTLAMMPGMPMGEREEPAVESKPGVYGAPATFGMGGAYDATITIDGPQGKGKVVLSLRTGQNTQEAPGFPWTTVIIFMAAVLFVAFVGVRMRRTGQRFNLRGVLNRQVLVSLVILGVALAVAIWVVNTQRRAGSMTPIEAQVMDMNAPAPEGTLPVRLATATVQPFASSVTYSGQAIGYTEQEVNPRVTGTILSINVYVGDRVHKGQVLARLDTTQLDPLVGEKIAGVNTAREGVGVAAMEYQQALNQVTQTRAEVSVATGELGEAKALLDAARQGRVSAVSDIASAEADASAALAEVAAAQADQTYAHQQRDRMKMLYDTGAVAKAQWDSAEASAKKADAAVDSAKQGVARAQASVASAKAKLKQTDSEIAAAQRKVQQSEANVRAKQAGVETAAAGAKAAKNRIAQSEAGTAEATAGLQGAAAQRGYADLKSEVDGVVTQRLISPGTLVSPGQMVLKVAQIHPIRLQANVAESDLARIRVGAPVKVMKKGANEKPLTLAVTSVSPALDPTSRTGVVEALYDNADDRFLPGQYLSMEIVTGEHASAVVIPSAAVQTETTDTVHTYVWVAKPAMNGAFTVSRKEVQIAGVSGDQTAIRSGLDSGAQVVLDPPQGMVAGVQVTSSETPPATNKRVVEVDANGYHPPSITIPAGKAAEVTFIRRTEDTCGTEIIFPTLGIRAPLPMNKPVKVTIPAQPQGKELGFTCPMDMLKGKAVAR